MKILSTQDYTLFKRIDGNRTVSQPHVNRLKEAIETDPSTITYNPIIVNDKWEVIDGQHRLEAIEALELPVHFIKVDDLNLPTVQKLNSVAKQWTPTDYAKSFRELGNENYKLYLDFKRQFGFNHEILLKYMSLNNYVTTRGFKEGKFQVKDLAESYKLCKQLQDVGEYYPRNNLRHPAGGFLAIARAPGYDHAHFLKKLKKHGYRINEQKNAVEFAREFERIYNFKSQQDTRLF